MLCSSIVTMFTINIVRIYDTHYTTHWQPLALAHTHTHTIEYNFHWNIKTPEENRFFFGNLPRPKWRITIEFVIHCLPSYLWLLLLLLLFLLLQLTLVSIFFVVLLRLNACKMSWQPSVTHTQEYGTIKYHQKYTEKYSKWKIWPEFQLDSNKSAHNNKCIKKIMRIIFFS